MNKVKDAIKELKMKPNYEEEFKKDYLYRYKEKTYRIIGRGLMKCPSSGDWIECVHYEQGMSPYIKFCREIKNFRNKFRQLL